MERKIEFRSMTVVHADSEMTNLDDALTLLPFLLAAATLQTINYSYPYRLLIVMQVTGWSDGIEEGVFKVV